MPDFCGNVELPERLAIKQSIKGLEGEELDLVTSIHCVAAPNGDNGMTLDDCEVVLLSNLLRRLGY